jgi:hypothetical protein
MLLRKQVRKAGYLPAADVTRILEAHPTQVCRLIDRGDVKGARIGHRRLIQVKSLLTYVQKHCSDKKIRDTIERRIEAAMKKAS